MRNHVACYSLRSTNSSRGYLETEGSYPVCGSEFTLKGRRMDRPPTRSAISLAQPIEASFAKPDLNAPTSVSVSASVIGVENTHVPELMMMQPSL